MSADEQTFWSLRRLLLGMKVSRVWPYGACVIIYGKAKADRMRDDWDQR